jgi:hypothetical protein
MVNKIKLSLQTRFESFAEFFDTFGFVSEASNLKNCRNKSFSNISKILKQSYL